MKYKGTINDPKDLVTKEYVDTSISNVTALKPMKDDWTGSDINTATAASRILEDSSTQVGDAFLGGVEWNDLPFDGNGEVKAFVIASNIVQFELTSSNISPYAWFYNSWNDGPWRSYVPVVDNLTSTATTEALSANQGKVLSESKADKSNTYTKSEVDTTVNTLQPKTDNSLTTTSKQVTGAINEINGNRYTKSEIDTTVNTLQPKTDNSLTTTSK